MLFDDGGWTGLDPATALRASSTILAAGLLLAALEALWQWRDFRDGGIYSWKILALRHRLPRRPAADKVCGWTLGFPGVLALYALQAMAALAVLAWPWSASFVRPGLVGLALTLVVLKYRHGVGADGADQMFVVVSLPLAFHALLPGSDTVRDAVLVFIALQACLAYFAAGLSKTLSPMWRSGEAVFAILNTRSYGHPVAARLLLERPAAGFVLAWSVILMELLFPLCLVLAAPYYWIFLAWGLVFHLFCAVVMGLNNFLWAFASAYPAVLWMRAAGLV